MSTFSTLGAFATFAAYQRAHGSQEAATLYQLLYRPDTSQNVSSAPVSMRLTQYISSMVLAVAAGGYIVGIHGHLLPAADQSESTIPETISMLWLIAMCVIALFGMDGNAGFGLFGTAWNDMVDWLHEQAKDEE